jgi:LacI family transcriptional regulator
VEKRGITIYDLAKEAHVSPATVSRVLTGSSNVSSEKKNRVLSLIEKYNYKPNALARGLSDTRTKVIGILTADIRNPYYAAVFIACEQAANNRGYTLILCNSLNDNLLEEHYLEKLEEQRVDAIILVGGRADELVSDQSYVEHVNKISNYIPIIVTGKLDGTDCYQVNLDQVWAVEIVMDHLIEKGSYRHCVTRWG